MDEEVEKALAEELGWELEGDYIVLADGSPHYSRRDEIWQKLVSERIARLAAERERDEAKKESIEWAKGLAKERDEHAEQVRAMHKFASDLEESLEGGLGD